HRQAVDMRTRDWWQLWTGPGGLEVRSIVSRVSSATTTAASSPSISHHLRRPSSEPSQAGLATVTSAAGQ
ncbi:hypothetical protein V500_06945, partial [Pseudogymnoascus sp. VKM F-4518 (FW-2643)]